MKVFLGQGPREIGLRLCVVRLDPRERAVGKRWQMLDEVFLRLVLNSCARLL